MGHEIDYGWEYPRHPNCRTRFSFLTPWKDVSGNGGDPSGWRMIDTPGTRGVTFSRPAAFALDIVLTPDGTDIEPPELPSFLEDAENCANYYVPSDAS